MRTTETRKLLTAALLGAAGLAGLPAPASADAGACEYIQNGLSLGCVMAPTPSSPTGPLAVGAGSEIVPAPPGQDPDTQTFVCVYGSAPRPTCVTQAGLPVLFSVGVGTI
jgi:hypothetical protein